MKNTDFPDFVEARKWMFWFTLGPSLESALPTLQAVFGPHSSSPGSHTSQRPQSGRPHVRPVGPRAVACHIPLCGRQALAASLHWHSLSGSAELASLCLDLFQSRISWVASTRWREGNILRQFVLCRGFQRQLSQSSTNWETPNNKNVGF